MSKQLLRIKTSGACVIEIDPDVITVMRVVFDEDIQEHMLLIGTASDNYIICHGNLDICHFKLNQLHELLDITLIDL